MLVDPALFKVRMTQLHSAVFADSRMPECVFRPDYARFQFLDFDSFSSDGFLVILKRLMAESGDQHVTLAALEPDPDLYFRHHFGSFGVLDIPLALSAEGYRDLLNSGPGPVPDTLMLNWNVLVWFPPSLKWLIWAERGPEMMVLAFARSLECTADALLGDSMDCLLTVEDALDISSPAWRDRSARMHFAHKLINNYGSGRYLTDSAPGRAVALANRIIAGEIGVIEASRTFSLLQFEFDAPLREVFQPFVAIDSETDDLPVGPVRREWSSAALEIRDVQIANYEKDNLPLALAACKKLIDRLRSPLLL
jgi:hypothetical protein